MTTTMTSVEREREGLPRRTDPMWVEAWAQLAELEEEARIALVRCEAGRTYSRLRAPVKELREAGLVRRNAWRPTLLGRCVVELMCR